MESVVAPKSGTVLDDATGLGASRATVVIWAYFHVVPKYGAATGGLIGQRLNSNGSLDGTLYRYVTTADALGNYQVPNMSTEVKSALVAFRGKLDDFYITATWTVYAIKLGFVMSGDTLAASFDGYGRPIRWETKTAKNEPLPKSPGEKLIQPWEWSDEAINMDSIRLVKMNENLTSQLFYYANAVTSLGPSLQFPRGQSDYSSAALALRKELGEYYVEKVCSLRPTASLSLLEATAIEKMIANREKYIFALRQLQPDAFVERESFPVFKEQVRGSSIAAGGICTAAKSAEKKS